MSLPNPPEQALTPLGQLEHLLALINGAKFSTYEDAVEKIAQWKAVGTSTDTQLILKISECQLLLQELKEEFLFDGMSGLHLADIEPALFSKLEALLTRIEEEWT